MGQIQLQVFNKFNQIIGITNKIAVPTRTWVRNDIGAATIQIPMSLPNAKALVDWGNIYRITEGGVPAWIGPMTERKFQNGTAELGCKSAEWLLTGKVTGQGKLFGAIGGADVASVARELFHNAAIQNNGLAVLQPGTFYHSATIFREYNYADAYESIKKLADDTGADFWVDDKLRLNFTNRGSDKRTAVILREDTQLFDVNIVESAEEVETAVLGLGNGSTVVDKPKHFLYQPGTPFFRARTLEVSGAATPEQLDATVRGRLAANAYPKMSIDCSIYYAPGSTWWVGDIITLVLKSHPFVSRVYVVVKGLERTSENLLRGILEVIPTSSGNYSPYTPF